MLRIAISLPDATALRWRVQEMRRRAKDLREAFWRSETPVRNAILSWFSSEGRGGWVGLARKTIMARANRWGYYRQGFREGPVHRILHARHRLLRSLTEPGPGHVSGFTARSWTLGSNIRYAAIHHRGGAIGMSRNPLPPRPLIPRDDTLSKIVADQIKRYVMWPWRQRRA